MRAVIVSESFGDILSVTLPYNREHFTDVLVVTSPKDEETIKVAIDNNARVFTTNSFWKNGADFNKFLALEEGLSSFDRYGWLALIDADTLWPKNAGEVLRDKQRGKLYSFKRRRLLLDPTQSIPPEEEWDKLPLDPQYSECMGFTQVFYARDAVLGQPPWHRIDLPNAGLGDSLFQHKWDLADKVWLGAAVLHIGNYATNWCGRVVDRVDGKPVAKAEENKKKVDLAKKRIWG